MKSILVKTNDTFQIIDSDNLRSLVNGYVEVVRPTAGYIDKLLLRENVFVCDEEGLCKEKETNYFGTLLYNGLFGPQKLYPIAGDIVIIGMDREDFRSLTNEEVDYYNKILKLLRFKEVGELNSSII